jgi:uncharacterized membrane protein YedE/YeeE
MRGVVSLLSGLIFGIGLIVADMTNPAKVQNFLDIAGTWDPSLIFVMGGAIAVTMPCFMYLKKQEKPLFGEDFGWPSRTDLDPKLVTGSAIFGFGWGLGGFCPGPAMTALPGGVTGTALFVACMLAGIWASNLQDIRRADMGTV